MTLRVDPARTAPPALPAPTFDPPPRPTGESPAAPNPDPLTLAENLRRFVEASRADDGSGRAVAPGRVVAPSASVDAEVSDRIRSFYNRLDVQVPVLAGEPGETRRVAVPFRMSHESDNAAMNAALLDALGSAPSRSRAGLVIAGRATPGQLAGVVHDLAQRHPEEFAPSRSAEQVRDYLRSLGVGIDCAGSVQLALFDSRGFTPESGRAHFQLRTRLNEDLTQLTGKPQFAKVADPGHLRPSDLIILKPPRGDSVGHTVIVTDRTSATLTGAEASALARYFPSLAVAGKPVIKISVASSFGYEGPQERVWVYDPATQAWGDLGGQLFDDDGSGRRTPANSRAHSGPWDHEIHGMYHPK